MQHHDDNFKKAQLMQLLNLDEAALTELLAQNSNIALDDLVVYATKIHEENIFFKELEQRFARNLEVFKSYRPNLYKFFKDYKPNESFDFIKTGPDSADLSFVASNVRLYNIDNAHEYYHKLIATSAPEFVFNRLVFGKLVDNYGQIYCRYFNEALDKCQPWIDKRQYQVTRIGHIPHLLLMGVGLGYVIEPIFEHFDIDTGVIIEPNPDIFYASLYTTDYAAIITNLKEGQWLEFVIGHEGLALATALNDIYMLYGDFLFSMSLGVLGFEHIEYQKELIALQNQLKSAYTAGGFPDDVMFGLSHSINHLEHKRSFVKADVHLSDSYKDTMVFVIGNGPSLDNDIAFLRKNQDKAYIIACGSAIDTLYNLGIKPDMYVATERINGIAQTLEIFKDTNFLDDIVIAATSVVHPDTIACFKHCMLFGKYTENLGKVLKGTSSGQDFENKVSYLNFTNPLVGNAGLDIAITLGFKHIYLFGLDNGRVLGDERLHSAYNDLFKAQGLKEQSAMAVDEFIVDGNFGHKIVSNTLYKNSAECMQMALHVSEGVTCYNLSDGAKLEGTIPVHSNDLDLSHASKLDKAALNAYFMQQHTFVEKYAKESINAIFDHAKFNATADALLHLLEQKYTNRSDLLRIMQECSVHLRKLDDTGSDYVNALILSTACTNFFDLCISYIYTLEDESKALESGAIILSHLSYLIADLKRLYAFMPDYVQDRHIDLLQGFLGFDHLTSKAPAYDRHFYIRPEGKIEGKRHNFVKRYI